MDCTDNLDNSNQFNITIVRGTDFYLPVAYVVPVGGELVPVDLTGWTAQMQVRPTYASTGTAVVDISTADGTINIDLSGGKFELNIARAVTVNIPAGSYVYDLLITNASRKVEQIIYGNVDVRERATK